MKIEEFCSKWGVSTEAIYMLEDCPAIYTPLNSKVKYIDESFFIRRKNFARKVTMSNHNFYYFLNEHMKITNIAELVTMFFDKVEQATLQEYLYSRMFQLDEKTILSYKITNSSWVLYRFSRAFMRALARRSNQNIDIDLILDKRMLA